MAACTCPRPNSDGSVIEHVDVRNKQLMRVVYAYLPFVSLHTSTMMVNHLSCGCLAKAHVANWSKKKYPLVLDLQRWVSSKGRSPPKRWRDRSPLVAGPDVCTLECGYWHSIPVTFHNPVELAFAASSVSGGNPGTVCLGIVKGKAEECYPAVSHHAGRPRSRQWDHLAF
jgi:hypothetical protein